MSELDPTVVERYAAHLSRKAKGVVRRWTAALSLSGALVGAVTLTSWANWPVPHREAYGVVLLGALAGGILGRSLGAARAVGLQLQSQLAEHQLQFERTTLAATAVVARREPEPVAAAVPLAPPVVPAGSPPVSAPAPSPAPVAPAPVVPAPVPVAPAPVPAVHVVPELPPAAPEPQPGWPAPLAAPPAPSVLEQAPAPPEPVPVAPAPAPALTPVALVPPVYAAPFRPAQVGPVLVPAPVPPAAEAPEPPAPVPASWPVPAPQRGPHGV